MILSSYLTLQLLKRVGFLYTFTSKHTRKHKRLMNFYKTFTTKDASVSISDSIRLVSKPYIFYFYFYFVLSIPPFRVSFPHYVL